MSFPAGSLNALYPWTIRYSDGSLNLFGTVGEACEWKNKHPGRGAQIVRLGVVDEDPVGETEVEVTSYLFSYITKTGTSGAVSYNRRDTAEGDRQYMIGRGTSCSELQEIKQKIKVQKKLNA